MTAANPCFRALTTAAVLTTLIAAGACDDAKDFEIERAAHAEQLDQDGPMNEGPVFATQVVDTEGWGRMTTEEIAEQGAKYLELAGPEDENHFFQCTLDTFQFRTTDNTIAVTGAPGQLLPPAPDGISTFNDPTLEDGFVAVVTLEDLNGDQVGFASEQELLDLENFAADTTYTLTIPGRGTLMLKQRESFEILFDAVSDMLADEEPVRSFNPPLVEVLTIQGTGKVVGGSDEFAGKCGIWQEIGIIHGIDLTTNTFDLEVVLQALHC